MLVEIGIHISIRILHKDLVHMLQLPPQLVIFRFQFQDGFFQCGHFGSGISGFLLNAEPFYEPAKILRGPAASTPLPTGATEIFRWIIAYRAGYIHRRTSTGP